MFDKLKKEIDYAKTSLSARELLFEVKGKIEMAFELNAVTSSEYSKLSHCCVAEGINNPKYF